MITEYFPNNNFFGEDSLLSKPQTAIPVNLEILILLLRSCRSPFFLGTQKKTIEDRDDLKLRSFHDGDGLETLNYEILEIPTGLTQIFRVLKVVNNA